MGFSWSLLFCQYVLTNIAETSLNAPNSTLMRDRHAPAIFKATRFGGQVIGSGEAHYVYVDNLEVARCRHRSVQQGLQKIVDGLETKGLLTHEFSVADTASPLGVSWDGVRHCTALSAKRYWRVAQAVRFALSRRAVPGWCWELLIGHPRCTTGCLADCLADCLPWCSLLRVFRV